VLVNTSRAAASLLRSEPCFRESGKQLPCASDTVVACHDDAVQTMAKANLANVLSRLYANRFSESDLAEMREVWTILVRHFFQKRIPTDASVLDFGAGPCLFINVVNARRRIALDANPEVRRFASQGVEVVENADLSLDAIRGPLTHVFISNFLEHLPDYMAVIELLTRIHNRLEEGGAILILQPNFRLEPRRYFDFIDHMTILTDASLCEALRAAGFEIAEIRARFLPFTSKSRIPKSPWLVRLYLLIRPLQWLFGKQTFVMAVKR
jgi:hypothetical protein